MADTVGRCPGVTLAEMPMSERSPGRILVEPACSKAAYDFLKRRFRVEEKRLVETAEEVEFVITPRVYRTRGKTGTRVRWKKPIQFELPLPT